MVFRWKRAEAKNWSGRMNLRSATRRMFGGVRKHPGPYTVEDKQAKNHPKTFRSSKAGRTEVRKRGRMADVGDAFRVTCGNNATFLLKAVQPVQKGWLPDQAKCWPEYSRKFFLDITAKFNVEWWGSWVIRNARGSTSPSQHSWPGQAHDFHPVDEHGSFSRAEGDRLNRYIDGKPDWFAIWDRDDPRGLHDDHNHGEHQPRKTGAPPTNYNC
jgi:hypothetical protein